MFLRRSRWRTGLALGSEERHVDGLVYWYGKAQVGVDTRFG